MATGTVQCPNCGGQFSVDSSMAMQNVRCPHCGESIYLEGFESEPQSAKTKGLGGRTKEYAAPRISTPSRSIDQAPKERPKVFLHILLVAIVASLVFLSVQVSRLYAHAFRLCEHMSKVNDKLEGINGKLYDVKDKLADVDNKLGRGNRIVGYKIINYTWEYSYSMDSEFKEAIEAGYEPVGYICQNGIKGGFFLFVKRAK